VASPRLVTSIPRRRRPVPFVLAAPAAVFLLGASSIVALSWLGLLELERHAERASLDRAELVADTLAERLALTPTHQRHWLLERAAESSHSTFLLLGGPGEVLEAVPGQPLSNRALQTIEGMGTGPVLGLGERAGYLVDVPSSRHRLLVFSPHLESRDARNGLLGSMLLFAIFVVGGAGFVAWSLARDVQEDVLFLGRVIADMAVDGRPDTRHVPIRTIDQVGQLTASFNLLLERFQAAERAYRADLQRANAFDRDRSAFLAALSHELRTPLNGILGFADVLLSEIDGPLSADSRENLTIVRTSAEHLRSLIDDILAYSALESGEFRLSREALDLNLVAHDVVTEARVAASQKGLSLVHQHDGAEGPTVAEADRRRMRQVLQNVVSNAIKFTSKGSVTVTVRRAQEEILLVVADTGPGIEPGDLERIFHEFAQSSAGAAQRGGTGLGLSITRQLVELHGGRVSVTSEVGVGSTFTIRIPVKPPRELVPTRAKSMSEPTIRHTS
jgi:signal transduction histidine kinase